MQLGCRIRLSCSATLRRAPGEAAGIALVRAGSRRRLRLRRLRRLEARGRFDVARGHRGHPRPRARVRWPWRRARVEAALKPGYDQARRAARRLVDAVLGALQVSVPEPHILQQYYLVRYFYGAASRRGAPPDAAARRVVGGRRLAPAVERRLPQRPQHPDDLHRLPHRRRLRRRARASSTSSGTCCPPSASSRATSTARPGAAVPGRDEPGRATAGRLGPIQPLAHDGRLERAPVLPPLAPHRRRHLPARPRLSVLPRDRHVPARALLKPDTERRPACCRSPVRRRSSTTRAAPSSSPTATTTSPA